MRQKFKIAGWVAIGALTGALTTVSLQTAARANMAPLPLEELQQLAAVFSMVKSDYVEPVDEKKLISDAITGMVASLDPHSQYYDKKSFKEFREGTTGRFVGVGIEITQEEGLIKIVSPIEGSPAFRGGIKSGDMITKIDDTAVKGLSLNDAVKRMRGEPGTKVLLTIYRKDENRTFPVNIIREEIKTQSVKGKVMETGYGWIRLSQFQDRSVDDFTKKLEDIYNKNPNSKAWCWTCVTTPVVCSTRPWPCLPCSCLRTSTCVHNANWLRARLFIKASPEFYRRNGGNDLWPACTITDCP